MSEWQIRLYSGQAFGRVELTRLQAPAEAGRQNGTFRTT